ncbi:MAG: hypothetical protein KF897_03445 [Opitutaceae bacterium]|nr:hypothetical protein [Opitutaceae bacterium]
MSEKSYTKFSVSLRSKNANEDLSDFCSPDPVKRAKAWASLYQAKGTKIAANIRRHAPWLTREEARSLVNDAFINVQKYTPDPARESNPISMVSSFARRRAYSLYRRKKAKKRNQPTLPLDTVQPSPETDLGVPCSYPEPFLPVEIRIRIADYPRLQRIIAAELIASPDSTLGEIARAITPTLGRRPTEAVVSRSQAVIRKKLKPFSRVIRRELSQ